MALCSTLIVIQRRNLTTCPVEWEDYRFFLKAKTLQHLSDVQQNPIQEADLRQGPLTRGESSVLDSQIEA